MLWLYRQALRLRRRDDALGDGPLTWRDSEPGVLEFSRGGGFVCVTNLSSGPIALPEHTSILLASTPLVGGMLPPDSTAWLRSPTGGDRAHERGAPNTHPLHTR